MIKPKYKWKLTKPAEYISDELTSKLKLTPNPKNIRKVNRLLINTIEFDHFRHRCQIMMIAIERYELAKAIERIKRAIANDEKILVYGDYDAELVLPS